MEKIVLLVVLVLTNSASKINKTTPVPTMSEAILASEAPATSNVQTNFIPRIVRETHSHFMPTTYGNRTRIEFSNDISFDTKDLGKNNEPTLPPELKYAYQGDETGYYIVQFSGPVYQTQKDWLNEHGIQIHFYISNYGFVCSVKDQKTADEIRNNPSVNWMGVYQPAYKISALFERVGEEHKTTILLFMDADISSVLKEVKTITQRTEFTTSDNGINKMIMGVISKKDLNALAHVRGIYWIEPYLQPKLYNSDVQWIVQDGQLDVRNIWDKGIAGDGEIVNTLDSGINTGHYAHQSGSPQITTWGYYPTHNAIVAYDSGASTTIVFGDGAGSSWHGTHTAGTLTGDDTLTAGTSNRDGVAKRAKIYFLDGGDNASTSIYTFGDLNDCYIRPYNRYYPPTRAYVSSNSWGSDAAGAYTTNCLNVDQFMWTHKDFLLCYSNGNAGSVGSVGSPAAAKNCVSVGGCRNGSSYTQYYSTTSRGPTQDGRLKPTILTPGQSVYSSTSGTSTYTSLSGTSMASPSAAGAAALVRQYLREGWYPTGKKNPANSFSYISASLLKAILINGADPNITGYTVPDNNIGWGRIDLDSTLYFADEARKTLLVDNIVGLLTGEQVDYHLNIPSSASNLKLTVVWTDYPGNPAVNRQLVNDLDLAAYNGGNYYYGNQYSGGQSIQNPSDKDSINVEECIRVDSPDQGDWLVRVEARNIPCGPQPFSLVITYNAGSVGGVVSIDKPVYKANDFSVDTVHVRVEDSNYGSVSIIDSVLITIHGNILETAPESIWCLELAESSFVFKADVPLYFNKGIHGDKKISVGQGDTITVAYADVNPSYTSTTWASIDAEYFIISNVHCENIKALSANVCWVTNENANSIVYYGTNPSNLNQTASEEDLYRIPHSVEVTGLSAKTTYYYDVESKDFRGNRVRDNNGGQHYSFTTKPAGSAVDICVALADGDDKSTEQGEALPDLRGRFQSAMDRGGWTYTYWETSDHNGELPPRSELKNYKAIFVPNQDEYPPFLRPQQETIKVYEENGGRIAFSAHDFLWHAWANSSDKSYDTTWCKNYLQARYVSDITSIGTFKIYGVAGDPVSGDYTAGVNYSGHRDGAAADQLNRVQNPPSGWDTGVADSIWRWNSLTGMVIGSRWESTNNHGTPGNGVWGGYKTRTIMNAFSATQMDTLVLPEILNKEFIWLIGHDHPDADITSPAGGNTYTSSPISIEWTFAAYGGAAIDSTWIEYSPNGGNTWIDIASGPGLTSPYAWNVSTLQNNGRYQVRITVSDKNVYPSLKGIDATTNFTINIPGNDDLGPAVIPQTITVTSNPKIVTVTDNQLPFSALVSDSFSGLTAIKAAEWSIGSAPASAGNGNAMAALDGSFNNIQETVIDTIQFTYLPGTMKVCSLWVRGRDASTLREQNWGNALMRTFLVIDGQPVLGISDDGYTPICYAFSSPLPNPFRGAVTIYYGIPKTKKVNLKIYNCLGQAVKTLVNETVKPGFYKVYWNGRDDLNRNLSAGIYFCRMSTDDYTATKKMIMVK